MSASEPEQTQRGATRDADIPDEADGQRASVRPSRRAVLGGLAVGSMVAGAPAVAGAQGRRGDRQLRQDERSFSTTGSNVGQDSFSRMFQVETFHPLDDDLTRMLAELGAPGGVLDAGDPLEAGAEALVMDPTLSINNADNPSHTAGTTFMGQFLDHDLTMDSGSRLGQPTPVSRSLNLRTGRFDLDSVYGGGPRLSPELYEDDDPFLFRIESGGQFEDLPRTATGQAIIADPRDDENLMVAGLHLAFLKFHNSLVSQLRASSAHGDRRVFIQASSLVRRHYQWLILHQFLPQFVGQAMVDDVLQNGRKWYRPHRPTIPVEFQVAAYRMGHSMIRPAYRANLAGDNGQPFFGLVFNPAAAGQDDPDDMSGGFRAPRRFIDWQSFFDFGDGQVIRNKRIDTRISSPLFQLPLRTISTVRGEPIGPTSLATRNLLRHVTWGIPSGQRIAELMGAPMLSDDHLADINQVVPALVGSTPLWVYILREADVFYDGLHLGPVGGRIVAEVFIGLLEMDRSSILRSASDWRPTLPSLGGPGKFSMVDLLTIAGVDPESRGQ